MSQGVALEPSLGRASEEPRLGAQLAREMRCRWRAGERVPAEDFLARHPGLSEDAEGAVDLIYEEYCLRESAGEQGVEGEMLKRFPQWSGELRVMLECHRRVIGADREGPRFPAVGDLVGDFRLVAELARGARGRVFLAKQGALADRPVVLKITPLDGAEHVSLARLQHTNIVPLYSVFDDANRGIRALCMPYFGRATLGSLLALLGGVPVTQRTGAQIVAAMDGGSGPRAASAARQMLERLSYVQAMCWIAACLADALAFAHERGVVHLDIKPSNVLLAGDGQPMLLDFHLAREPIGSGGPLPDNLGGTLPYMPAEQRKAMQGLQEGKPAKASIDGRADVYALGAILYEALGGRLPVTNASPALSRLNPCVSEGLADVVSKCVAERAEDRYADAQGLADDLRRHLTDQPLAGVRNRSAGERWRKWRRRRPGAFRTVGLLLAVVLVGGALLAGTWTHVRHRHGQAEAVLNDGTRQLSVGGGDAVETFERGIGLLEGLPFEQKLRGELREQLATARKLRLARQLHMLADDVRVLYGGLDPIGVDRLNAVAGQCAEFWERRKTIHASLNAGADDQVREDLLDIAIFIASVQSRLSAPAGDTGRVLDEAQSLLGPSAVIEYEGGLIAASSNAVAARREHTAWEHYALGRAMLAAGDLAGASAELSIALKLEPAGLWANFYQGLCAYRMRRYDDAITAFSVCIGNSSDVAGLFYNRGLAFAATGKREQALGDFDRALQLDPAHAEAVQSRDALK